MSIKPEATMVGKFQILYVGICRYRGAGRLMKLMAKTGPPLPATRSRGKSFAGHRRQHIERRRLSTCVYLNGFFFSPRNRS